MNRSSSGKHYFQCIGMMSPGKADITTSKSCYCYLKSLTVRTLGKIQCSLESVVDINTWSPEHKPCFLGKSEG